MADWGPVVIAVVLFVLLTPGLLFQIPGKGGWWSLGTCRPVALLLWFMPSSTLASSPSSSLPLVFTSMLAD
ncbi:hypothetical protein Pyn_06741 [Prunus yedoensis var. nudiflora]|uniref:Uncharacterized protein n=1 Tax=Prunus yedoensis var. nudiflora TaxID=2094558 RepID=A0A314ZDM8_PRUYE|nr:hypothetical protein Pyn_06741 [Prunus yedoensis var. nudiflora]